MKNANYSTEEMNGNVKKKAQEKEGANGSVWKSRVGSK